MPGSSEDKRDLMAIGFGAPSGSGVVERINQFRGHLPIMRGRPPAASRLSDHGPSKTVRSFGKVIICLEIMFLPMRCVRRLEIIRESPPDEPSRTHAIVCFRSHAGRALTTTTRERKTRGRSGTARVQDWIVRKSVLRSRHAPARGSRGVNADTG